MINHIRFSVKVLCCLLNLWKSLGSSKTNGHTWLQHPKFSMSLILCPESASGVTIPLLIVYSKGFPFGCFQWSGPHVPAMLAVKRICDLRNLLGLVWEESLEIRSSTKAASYTIWRHCPHRSNIAICSDVMLLCFSTKSTHFLQLCDVSLYKTISSQLCCIMQWVKMLRGPLQITKQQITAIIREAYSTHSHPHSLQQYLKHVTFTHSTGVWLSPMKFPASHSWDRKGM